MTRVAGWVWCVLFGLLCGAAACSGGAVSTRLHPDARKDFTLPTEEGMQWFAAVPAGEMIYILGANPSTEVSTRNIHKYQEPDDPSSIRSPGFIAAMDPETGALRWTRKFKLASADLPTAGSRLIAAGGSLIFDSPQTLAVLDREDGRARWIKNNARVRRQVIGADARHVFMFEPPTSIQVYAMHNGELLHSRKVREMERVEYAWMAPDSRHVGVKGVRRGATPDSLPLVMILTLDFDPDPKGESSAKAVAKGDVSFDEEIVLPSPEKLLRPASHPMRDALVMISPTGASAPTLRAWSVSGIKERWNHPLDEVPAKDSIQRLRTKNFLLFQVDVEDREQPSRRASEPAILIGSELHAYDVSGGIKKGWTLDIAEGEMVKRVVELKHGHLLLQTYTSAEEATDERLFIVSDRGRVIWRGDRIPERYKVMDRAVHGRTLIQLLQDENKVTSVRVHTLPETEARE